MLENSTETWPIFDHHGKDLFPRRGSSVCVFSVVEFPPPPSPEPQSQEICFRPKCGDERPLFSETILCFGFFTARRLFLVLSRASCNVKIDVARGAAEGARSSRHISPHSSSYHCRISRDVSPSSEGSVSSVIGATDTHSGESYFCNTCSGCTPIGRRDAVLRALEKKKKK